MVVLLLLFLFVDILGRDFVLCICSPHIRTIRKRITLGRSGEPVSALNFLFQENKETLDCAMKVENGYISHFEVLTALAFTLFAKEKVDIAVIEAGLGGARDAINVIPCSGLTVSECQGDEHLAALRVLWKALQ